MIRLKTQFRNDCSLPKSAAIFRGGDLQAEYGFIEEFAKVLPTEAKRFIRARYLNPTSYEEMIGKINSIDEMGMKGDQGFFFHGNSIDFGGRKIHSKASFFFQN